MPANQLTRTHSFLSFKIGDELYASNVNKVVSILEMTKITKIPRTQDFIRGVINLRGSVLPVVDLKIKFGLETTVFTTNTCILVLDILLDEKPVKIGALVDSVQEVLEISDEQILPPPGLGKTFQTDFIQGMFRTDDSFIMLLDMDSIFSSNEISYMSSSAMLFDEEPKSKEEEK